MNQWMLSRQFASYFDNATVITTIPIIADLIDVIPIKRLVYYCVDDFSTWPGLDHRSIEQMEQFLIERADRVIAASEILKERILQKRDQCDLLTHGVDLTHRQNKYESEGCREPNAKSPVYLFWGVIDQRMDISFLKELNENMNSGSIVLAGPVQNPPPELRKLSRIKILGAVPYNELPKLAMQANVLIMPYTDSLVTRAMQPLKMKEYLATGKPVVARRLPALGKWGNCANLVETADDFATKVISCGKTATPPNHLANRERLSAETWTSKAVAFQTMVASD